MIEDEIGSVQSANDSIVEDIVDSYISASQSSSSFEDFKRRQYKLVQDNKSSLKQFYTQVEQGISRERD